MKKRERIFIVPNWYGFMYGAGIVISLLTGATYANNLIYSLSFFLVGLFMVGMIQTNGNLKGVEIEKIQFSVAEEEGILSGKLWVRNNSGENHYNLNFRFPEISKEINFDMDKLSAKGIHVANFQYKVKEPGVHNFEKIHIRTIYPFGMFYSWKQFKGDYAYMVYPKPGGELELPNNLRKGESHHHQYGMGGEDFSEHKNYQVGESYHHVDWKAFARRGNLLTKRFEDGDRQNLFLDMKEAGGGNNKALRQMVAWVEKCHHEKISYALKLKSGKALDMGFGEVQKNRALRLIAGEWQNEAS